MAMLKKDELSVSEFGRDVDVPNDPIALLMYYFDSISVVLDIDKTEDNIRRLRDYRRYRGLSESEKDQLVIMCILFSPIVLINKCIFQDDDLCANSTNKFYNINLVSDRLLVTQELIIGGKVRKVLKILAFRQFWIEYCYFEPMKQMQSRVQRITDGLDRRQTTRTPLSIERGSSAQPRAGRTQPLVNSAQPRAASAQPRTGRAQTSQTPSATSSPPSSNEQKCVIL